MKVFILTVFIAVAAADSIYNTQYQPSAYNPQQYPAQPYSFAWAVKDAESYNDYAHSEKSDGNVAIGSYHVLLSDGRTQIVTYRTDGYGYLANVRYEGVIKYPQTPYAVPAYQVPVTVYKTVAAPGYKTPSLAAVEVAPALTEVEAPVTPTPEEVEAPATPTPEEVEAPATPTPEEVEVSAAPAKAEVEAPTVVEVPYATAPTVVEIPVAPAPAAIEAQIATEVVETPVAPAVVEAPAAPVPAVVEAPVAQAPAPKPYMPWTAWTAFRRY